jgi:hypothetical protein
MKTRALIYVFLCLSNLLFAQPTNSPPGDPGGDPDEVPISGIEWLILAGGGLGVKRFLDIRKKK